jgi:hypothetical protein
MLDAHFLLTALFDLFPNPKSSRKKCLLGLSLKVLKRVTLLIKSFGGEIAGLADFMRNKLRTWGVSVPQLI